MKPVLTSRIMVFGTFDGLHKGHLNFFRQARKLSQHPFLIASVALDKNVKKIKGRLPKNKQRQRLKFLANCPIIDRAVLGGVEDHLPHILKQRPDIIALGYDQTAYVAGLKSRLRQRGLKVRLVRLKAFYPKIYKSSLRPKIG